MMSSQGQGQIQSQGIRVSGTSSKSTECRKMEKSFAEKLHAHLEENPEDCDVAFLVGPTGEVIKASKLILVVSSPTFKKLFDSDSEWKLKRKVKVGRRAKVKKITSVVIPQSTSIVSNANAHPHDLEKDQENSSDEDKNDEDSLITVELPDFEPKAFRIFLKLLPCDNLCLDQFRALNLPAEDLLNLIAICKRFAMKTMHQYLTLLTKPLFAGFSSFMKTEDFLKLSPKNLKIVLSSEDIATDEIDIFESACKWAESRCSALKIDTTGVNIRNVLGDSLFELRFPVISYRNFGTVVCQRGVLTDDEELAILKYLTLDEECKSSFEGNGSGTSDFPFKVNVRKASAKNVEAMISIFKDYDVISTVPFICDAKEHFNFLYVDHKIAVYGVGFFGPIGADTTYDVEVEFRHAGLRCGEIFKDSSVAATKEHTFHIKFEEPIILEPNFGTADQNFQFAYNIRYCLKGSPTQTVDLPKPENLFYDSTVKVNGVLFNFQWHSLQLAEISFKKC